MNSYFLRVATAAAALTASVALGGISPPVWAAEPGMVPSETVSYADLDLSTAHGIEVLYRRINSAAHDVCMADSYASVPLQMRAKANACVEQALNRAIAKVGNLQLTALYVHKRARKYG